MTATIGQFDATEGISREADPDDSTAAPPGGLSRRVFGVLVSAAVAGTLGGGGLLAAVGGLVPRTDGVATSFGTVRIAAAERQARLPQDGAASLLSGPHERHGTGSEPANNTWGEHVALQLEIHNSTDRDVLFAPGQLRLRVGSSGPTVTNRDADEVTGPLAPGSTRRFWISFLVPTGTEDLRAEFTDPWRYGQPLALTLPAVVRRPGWLEESHE